MAGFLTVTVDGKRVAFCAREVTYVAETDEGTKVSRHNPLFVSALRGDGPLALDILTEDKFEVVMDRLDIALNS